MKRDCTKNDRIWYNWSMKPQRIVLYARVSIKDGRQDTENQLIELREFAAKEGLIIVREYIDQKSGKNGDRPEFQAMMKAAADPERGFDMVLFWRLDRFSREGVLETLQYLQELNKYGVCWKSLREQFLDTCGMFKDAVLSILASIARQERVTLSERTLAGLERARRQGRVGGRPKRIVDRQKIWDLRAAKYSLGEIAKQMRLPRSTVARICKDAA